MDTTTDQDDSEGRDTGEAKVGRELNLEPT